MQAVLTNGTMREFKDEKVQLRSLFERLDNADNTLKSSIENEIVNFGAAAIDFLIDKLTGARGTQRGVAAMSLIRIGENSIKPLRQLAEGNKNFQWVANYIIQEIEGTF
ncbi:MAG: hypothetical protein Q4F80_04160 [bacterium]|nr:hypothetical protein [bacterium]